MRLQDKVALVTGGTSGIGRAIAERFLSEGARVAIIGASSREKVARVADEIGAGVANGCERVRPFLADVSAPAEVEALIASVNDLWGAPDIVVNSAGVWSPTPVGGSDLEAVRRMIDVNLAGTFYVMNAVAPAMKARRAGEIVNLSSVVAVVPAANYSVYVAVKAGVIGLTRAAAAELAPFGVHVNAIVPGNVETPMNEPVRTAPELADRRAWIARITPSERQFTPPDEIAAAALFLVSGEVRAMYGAILSIDEGRSAGVPAR